MSHYLINLVLKESSWPSYWAGLSMQSFAVIGLFLWCRVWWLISHRCHPLSCRWGLMGYQRAIHHLRQVAPYRNSGNLFPITPTGWRPCKKPPPPHPVYAVLPSSVCQNRKSMRATQGQYTVRELPPSFDGNIPLKESRREGELTVVPSELLKGQWVSYACHSACLLSFTQQASPQDSPTNANPGPSAHCIGNLIKVQSAASCPILVWISRKSPCVDWFECWVWLLLDSSDSLQ